MFIQINDSTINLNSIVYWYPKDIENKDGSTDYSLFYRVIDGRVLQENFESDTDRDAKEEALKEYNSGGGGTTPSDALTDVSYDPSTGILKFTRSNGEAVNIDLPLELLIQSGSYNSGTKKIVLVLANGESIEIDVADLISTYYADDETIVLTSVDGKQTFKVKDGKFVEYGEGNNVVFKNNAVVPFGSALQGNSPDKGLTNLAAVKGYDLETENPVIQTEIGSASLHTNINSSDVPTIETTDGKKEIATSDMIEYKTFPIHLSQTISQQQNNYSSPSTDSELAKIINQCRTEKVLPILMDVTNGTNFPGKFIPTFTLEDITNLPEVDGERNFAFLCSGMVMHQNTLKKIPTRIGQVKVSIKLISDGTSYKNRESYQTQVYISDLVPILRTSNNTEYTPTDDYNPATKKYVDDSVSSIQEGQDGATFTPSVDDSGNLSWTNNKGLVNPDPVNIKGPKGDTGEPGQSGTDGASYLFCNEIFTSYSIEPVVGFGSYIELTSFNRTPKAGDEFLLILHYTVTDSYYLSISEIKKFSGDSSSVGFTVSGVTKINGITPTIGENGNWYLGETDTGKPSRGEQGPAGTPGTDGQRGPAGADGAPGEDGISITEITQGDTSESEGYTVTPVTINKSDSTNVVLQIKAKNGTNGAKGDPGDAGAQGAPGPANSLTIGTVSTLEAGEQATVQITGDAPNQVLNFGIPKGAQGATGSNGANGSDGAPGQGVPTGGTDGQVLVKNSATDYDTSWKTLADLINALPSITELTSKVSTLEEKVTELESKIPSEPTV